MGQIQDCGSRLSDKTQLGAWRFVWERRRVPGLWVLPGQDEWFRRVEGQRAHWLPGLLRPPVPHPRWGEGVGGREASFVRPGQWASAVAAVAVQLAVGPAGVFSRCAPSC